MQCACAHPGAVLKWSEYLGIFGHSDKGSSGHVLIHVLSWDVLGCFRILGYPEKGRWYGLYL